MGKRGIYLQDDLESALIDLSKEWDTSISTIVQEACSSFIENNKKIPDSIKDQAKKAKTKKKIFITNQENKIIMRELVYAEANKRRRIDAILNSENLSAEEKEILVKKTEKDSREQIKAAKDILEINTKQTLSEIIESRMRGAHKK